MIACLILGMGMPTTANYVVTATIAAPILLNEFSVPVIAAHMFVFYFGILADITPPVCLAAYAGAGIANANPMKSGVVAVRLALAGFIIPYIFVFEPAMLLETDNPMHTAVVTGSAILGMVALASGVTGYLIRMSTWPERIVLIIAGLGLVHPVIWTDIAALVVLVAVGAYQYTTRDRYNDKSPSPISEPAT